MQADDNSFFKRVNDAILRSIWMCFQRKRCAILSALDKFFKMRANDVYPNYKKRRSQNFQMRNTLKRTFTFLEIMIAMSILSIIGAVTVIQVKKMIDSHRFEEELSALFISLQEAQILSAAFQTDIALDFFIEKGTLAYRFTSDEPFSHEQLNQKDRLLPHTAVLKFKDAPVTALHFDIFSGGRIEFPGILAFHSKPNEEKAIWFDLQNGALIKWSYQKPPVARRNPPKP